MHGGDLDRELSTERRERSELGVWAPVSSADPSFRRGRRLSRSARPGRGDLRTRSTPLPGRPWSAARARSYGVWAGERVTVSGRNVAPAELQRHRCARRQHEFNNFMGSIAARSPLMILGGNDAAVGNHIDPDRLIEGDPICFSSAKPVRHDTYTHQERSDHISVRSSGDPLC